MKKKKALSCILLVATLLSLSGCGSSSGADNESGASGASQASQVAKEALHTLIPVSDFSLEDYRGKVVVLNFWASWCPPCKAEMPELDQLSQELNQRDDVVFISVNLTDGGRETVEKAEAYLIENGFSFDVVMDTEGELANEFRVSSIPQTFVLDANGETVANISGMTTGDAIMEKVEEALGAAGQ